ncbi:MAG: hypothetical protein ACTSVF_06000, partial [Candidatus Asgardarchaeia archaeon]
LELMRQVSFFEKRVADFDSYLLSDIDSIVYDEYKREEILKKLKMFNEEGDDLLYRLRRIIDEIE